MGNTPIQHSVERSQTAKCIQYNIHDTKSCELANYVLWIVVFLIMVFILMTRDIKIIIKTHLITKILLFIYIIFF